MQRRLAVCTSTCIVLYTAIAKNCCVCFTAILYKVKLEVPLFVGITDKGKEGRKEPFKKVKRERARPSGHHSLTWVRSCRVWETDGVDVKGLGRAVCKHVFIHFEYSLSGTLWKNLHSIELRPTPAKTTIGGRPASSPHFPPKINSI